MRIWHNQHIFEVAVETSLFTDKLHVLITEAITFPQKRENGRTNFKSV